MGETGGKKANKRVTRAVYASFITLAAAFIAVSVYDVAIALFGKQERPHVSAACGVGLRALVDAVDRAAGAAAAAANPDDARRRYAEAKNPEWSARKDEITRTCEADPNGAAALAAVARLDRAAETWIQRKGAELSPVRHEVDSFIR